MLASDVKKGSLVFYSRICNGFTHRFGIKLIEYKSGVFIGEIVSIEPNDFGSIWVGKTLYKKGEVISCVAKNCFIRNDQGICEWFKKKNGLWET